MADFGSPGTSLRWYFSVREPGEQNLSLSDSPEPPRSEKHKNVQPNQGINLRYASLREELNGAAVFKLASYGRSVFAANFFLRFFLTSFACFLRRKLVCYVHHGLVHWWVFSVLGFSFCWAWNGHVCRRHFSPSLCLTTWPFWKSVRNVSLLNFFNFLIFMCSRL